MSDARGPAIVTGAGRGIGRAVVERLTHEGWPVVAADVDGQAAERVAMELTTAGTAVTGLACDVGQRADVERLANTTLERFGPATALVNCAGVFPSSAFLELTECEWDRVLETNLKGAFLCGQTVAKQMVAAQRGGRIVHVSSSASRVARPRFAHYASSKAALNQLTQTMAIELAEYGIQVNAVCPGLIASEVVRAFEEDPANRLEHQAKMTRIPLARMGTPMEIAEVVAFLLGPGASYMTGSVVDVDGGYHCGIASYAASSS